MFRSLFLWIIILLVFVSADTSPNAVTFIQTNNLDESTLERLNDLLSVELGNTGVFTALNYADTEFLLRSNNISKPECPTDSCVAETGKLIDASVVITGTIDTADGLYMVNLNAVNSIAAKQYHTGNTAIPVTSEYLIVRFFKDFSEKVAAKGVGEFVKLGKLRITSSPDKIPLFINGDSAGVTPFTDENIKTGDYTIRLVQPGYLPVKEKISIQEGVLVEKQYTLQRTQAWLDSVSIVQKAARKDSILHTGKTNTKQSLPDMFLQLTQAVPADSVYTVAVLPFKSADSNNYSGMMAAEYGVMVFTQNPNFRVVDRTNLKAVLTELKFSRSDLVAEDKTLKSGKLLSARYIVTGTVTSLIPKSIVFTRLTDVETGEIVSAAGAEMKSVEMETFYRQVFVEKIKPTSSLFRSALVPGWGQFYSDKKSHGIIFITLAAAGAGALIWSALDYSEKDDEVTRYLDKDPSTVHANDTPEKWIKRANDAVDDKNSAALRTNILLAGVGIVWAANIIDAVVLGNKKSKEIKRIYFACVPEYKQNNISLYAGIRGEF